MDRKVNEIIKISLLIIIALNSCSISNSIRSDKKINIKITNNAKSVNTKSNDYLNKLTDLDCPKCGHLLYYCSNPAEATITAALNCTNCDYKSREFHMQNYTDSDTIKQTIIDLYNEGVFIDS